MRFGFRTSCGVLTISVDICYLAGTSVLFSLTRSLSFCLWIHLLFSIKRGLKNRERDRRAVRVRGNNKRQKDSENKGGDRREKQICHTAGKVSALLSDRKRRENEKELMSRERERFLGGLWFLFLIIHFTFPLNIPLMWWQTLSLSPRLFLSVVLL